MSRSRVLLKTASGAAGNESVFGIQKSLLTAQQGKCRIPRMPSGSPIWPDHGSKKCKCTYITLSKRHLDSR